MSSSEGFTQHAKHLDRRSLNLHLGRCSLNFHSSRYKFRHSLNSKSAIQNYIIIADGILNIFFFIFLKNNA